MIFIQRQTPLAIQDQHLSRQFARTTYLVDLERQTITAGPVSVFCYLVSAFKIDSSELDLHADQ